VTALRRLSWRRELLLLSVVLMEVCWLHPWTTVLVRLTDTAGQDIAAATLFAILLLVTYSTRLLRRLDISLTAQRLVTVSIALLSVLVFFWLHFYPDHSFTDWHWIASLARRSMDFSQRVPAEWPMLLIIAYLWWRGIRFVQQRLSPGSVGFYFRWGIIAYIWFHLVSIMWGGGEYVYSLIFGFFFSGLLSVALARAEDIAQGHAGIQSPFNGSWLGILLGGTLLVLLLGGAVASVLSVSGVQLLLRWLDPVLSVLRAVLNAVIIALAYLLQPLMWALVRLGEKYLGGDLLEELESGDALQELLPTDEQMAATPWYLHALKITVVLMVIGLVVLVIYWTVNRRQQRDASGRREERESVWSTDELRQDLLDTWRARLRKMRDGLTALGQLGRDRYSFISVRRVYASVVKAATRAGYPREASSTPYEYVTDLDAAFRGSEADVRVVTEAYVRAHYGEVPFSSEELARVRGAGSRLVGRVVERPAVASDRAKDGT